MKLPLTGNQKLADATDRFSNRVDQYVKFRPGYPAALVLELVTASGVHADSRIADIGSGSGIFSRHLLARGLQVHGVEPNHNMRRSAEQGLAEYHNFRSVDGSAEDTGLDNGSIDLITAAQAFHWFNNDRAKAEFQRILRPGGQLALIWNKRRLSQPFQQAYVALLKELAPDYDVVNHMNLSENEIAPFFADGQMLTRSFANSQRLDLAGLLGRLQSASYCPPTDSPAYAQLATALETLFNQHAAAGFILFEYDSKLYLGPISR